MEFSLKALSQLIAVVEEGSFTRAAERMNVAQPWLSARVRKLEDVVGLTLLDRSTRHVRPTADGEVFLAQARVVVREARHLAGLSEDLAKGAGRLRVGAAPYTYFMPERQALFEGFVKAAPNIMLEIENHQDPDLRRAVLRGDLEAAIVTGSVAAEYDSLFVCRYPLMLMIPREHPLASCNSVPLSRLAGITIGAVRRSANPVAFDQTFGRLAAVGARILELPEPNRQAQVDFARRQRLILGTLSDTPDDSSPHEHALEMRPIADSTICADIFLIRRREKVSRRALDRFWTYARAALAR